MATCAATSDGAAAPVNQAVEGSVAAIPTMYQLLVRDPEDVLAALAYAAYKQHKIEVMHAYTAASGAAPTQSEINAFYMAASAPAMLEMHADRAARLADVFLLESLKSREIALESDFATTNISKQLQAIQDKLMEKRTLRGWARDVTGNLAVSFMSLLFIAALVIGYRALDEWMEQLGKTTGVLKQDAAGPAKPAAPQR